MCRVSRVVLSTLFLLAVAAAALAQPPGEARKPGPEVQKLGYFAGSWKIEGEAKPSDFGPGGKFTGEENCEWFAGGFQLVCQSSQSSAMGPSKGMTVLAYDPEEKVYTFYAISSMGESVFGKGDFAGDAMNTTWEGKMGGKPVKIRGAMVPVSPTSYTFKMEASMAGGPWIVLGEGTQTKVK